MVVFGNSFVNFSRRSFNVFEGGDHYGVEDLTRLNRLGGVSV
jgi:hypothetical protein